MRKRHANFDSGLGILLLERLIFGFESKTLAGSVTATVTPGAAGVTVARVAGLTVQYRSDSESRVG